MMSLVGDLVVVNRTLDDLEDLTTAVLKLDYLTNPQARLARVQRATGTGTGGTRHSCLPRGNHRGTKAILQVSLIGSSYLEVANSLIKCTYK